MTPPPSYGGEDGRWQPRSGGGPRRTALARKKKQRRRKTALSGALIAVVGVAVAGSIALWISRDPAAIDNNGGSDSAAAAGDAVTTLLLYGTHQEPDRTSPDVVWMTLLSLNSTTKQGSVVYIPAHTAAEVPGRGLHALADTIDGGVPLLQISTEGLLGVSIDRYLEMSDRDARVLFEGIGELSVDVPVEVRVPAGNGNVRVLLGEGPQLLNSDFLVPLLYEIGVDGDDQELASRHLAFWDALFERYASDPQGFGRAITSAGASLQDSNHSPQANASFLAGLTDLSEESRTITTLPVTQVSVGDSELYEVDDQALAELLDEAIGEDAQPQDLASVQILNGNGVPGIGQEVAQRLVGKGFRVFVSGNSRGGFNEPKTLLIIYERTTAAQDVAEQARELLGLGEVQIQAQGQGIVDLTIVVGKDFLKSR